MNDENALNKEKEFLFKENIRLKEERERFEEERERFEREKADTLRSFEQMSAKQTVERNQIRMKDRLVARKLELLEREYARLEQDRKKFEEEKEFFDKNKRHFQSRQPVQNFTTYIGTDFLFSGVDSEFALKKRYRDLLKIFHPDNIGGDSAIIQDINKEYDSLKKKFG